MPNEDFHVHGAHDHTLEHAAEHGEGHGAGADLLPGRVAALSAVLATLGALMTFAGGDTQAKAQLYKNTATITKTHENDEWNEYQAEGIKRHVADASAVLTARVDKEKSEFYQAEAERYHKQQGDIKARALKLEEEVKEWDEKSEVQMHLHHRWALGATAMQIAIALSAITLLARRTWLLYAVGLVGVGGVTFGAMALAGI